MAEKRAGRRASTAPHRDEPALLQEVHTGSSDEKDRSGSDTSLVRPETWRYQCTDCGTNALDFTHAPHRDGGGFTVKIHCFGCGAGLDDVHAATGIPRYRLLTWPPPEELGPTAGRTSSASGRTGEPPSEASVDGYCSALWSNRRAFGWLQERGLSGRAIEWAQLGYDVSDDAITIPVRDAAGELVNLRRRFLAPDADPKIVGLRGRGSQLYPKVPPRGTLLLVAGEFDAMIGRQHRLRTVTTTCGATLPAHLVPALAGRPIAVMYDVGEEAAAAATVEKLCAAGSEAWVVRLSRVGLPRKADLSDLALTCGTYTHQVITCLVRHERSRYGMSRGGRTA